MKGTPKLLLTGSGSHKVKISRRHRGTAKSTGRQSLYVQNAFLHMSVAEICSRRSPVPIVHCKVQDVLCQLGEAQAILVLLAFADVGSTAHLLQADFGDGLAVLNAGRQQNRLVNAVIPDPKIVPGGWPPATV